MTILIAEDSPVVQKVAAKVFNFQKINVLVARNGQELKEKVATPGLRLVFLDIQIPIADGFECITFIRDSADQAINQLPVYAMTGNAANLSEADYIAKGFTGLIQKPIDYDKLVQMVLQYRD